MTMRDKIRQGFQRSDKNDDSSDKTEREASSDATDPPGTVSNQNGEEAETGLQDAG